MERDTSKNWFSVDETGLGRLIGELVQNALDEVGVTTIAITLAQVPSRPLTDLTVEDDSPKGFKDLSHAYTLFAHSYKRDNPEQRGQYNFGEKLVLAVCEGASIATTTGTVVFDPTEGRIYRGRAVERRVVQREAGRCRASGGRICPTAKPYRDDYGGRFAGELGCRAVLRRGGRHQPTE